MSATTTTTPPPPSPSAQSDKREMTQDLRAILIELGITGLIAAALVFPLITLRTIDSFEGLTINARWLPSVLAVALVVLGRFGLILLRYERSAIALAGGAAAMLAAAYAWSSDLPLSKLFEVFLFAGGLFLFARAAIQWLVIARGVERARIDTARADAALALRRAIPLAAAVVVVFVAFLPWLPFSSIYMLDVGILILTYVLLGWGLNIIVGYAGLLDLGYVAFYAVGAYAYAIFAVNFGLSFWWCLPLAGLLAGISGLILGFPVLRLRGDYFAIVTLGFGEIVRLVLINWSAVTRGPDGISSIPRPSLFGVAEFNKRATGDLPLFHEMLGIPFSPEHRIIFLYYLVFTLSALVAIFTLRIRTLPIGRAWEALREDDIASASLGLNRTRIKLVAFGISAAWGGFAGAFFATRQGFISPESFTFIESAIVLSIVVLGGMGSLVGIAIAAALLIGLPEVFRELSEFRMVAYGGGLVLIMVWRPRGLLSFREPSVRLFDRRGRMRFAAEGYAVGDSPLAAPAPTTATATAMTAAPATPATGGGAVGEGSVVRQKPTGSKG
ncbi:MAG: high-affinity branched-chain amino acid ABC transporter permease LivM [Alphaproteobacteria bacterium]|nr:high-affinity branched-chain amino acid ABC transporter permease LivM [Alphaproteobacteria bacterium]MDA7987931.1 high-affinity branched-chain amino acid ABC transporter permease LivM [Alphaproteobacteria bacterium]